MGNQWSECLPDQGTAFLVSGSLVFDPRPELLLIAALANKGRSKTCQYGIGKRFLAEVTVRRITAIELTACCASNQRILELMNTIEFTCQSRLPRENQRQAYSEDSCCPLWTAEPNLRSLAQLWIGQIGCIDGMPRTEVSHGSEAA